MTRKYNRTLSNGVTVKLKIHATSGRRVIGGITAINPKSKIEIFFSAPTFQEDEAQSQSELDAFIAESAKDMGRETKGTILFGKVKILTYEIPNEKENETSPLGDNNGRSGEARESGGEARDGTPGSTEATGDGIGGEGAHAAAVADNGEIVPATEAHPGGIETDGGEAADVQRTS